MQIGFKFWSESYYKLQVIDAVSSRTWRYESSSGFTDAHFTRHRLIALLALIGSILNHITRHRHVAENEIIVMA